MDRRQDERTNVPALLKIIDEAKALGAEHAELLVTRVDRAEHVWAEGRRAPAKKDSKTVVSGVVTLHEGQAVSFTLPDLAGKGLKPALEAAINKAKKLPADPDGGPAERYPITLRGLSVDDPRYPNISEEDRDEVLLINREACAESPGVDPTRITYQEQRRARSFVSSRGFDSVAADTLYHVIVEGRDSHSGRVLAHSAVARNFANVGSLPYGVELTRRLMDLRDEVPMPPGEPALILESRVLAGLLRSIAPAFSAELVERGASFVSKAPGGKLGNARIHLIDDGGLTGAPYTLAFDDRGVSPMPIPIIREGVLGGLYHTPATARRHNARPTGHQLGGALVPSNLGFRSGNRSRTQMLGEVNLGLAPDHLTGKIDLNNGTVDLRGPALVLERGQRRGAVREIRVKTTIIELFTKVVEVASDQERHDGVDCATTLIRGVPLVATAT